MMPSSVHAKADASFITRVRDALNKLPPTERKLGEFILDFSGDLSSYSASELAGLTGVSNATITRFIRRLGYENYEAARRHSRSGRSDGAALFLLNPVPGVAGSMAAHIQQAQDNISATFNQISGELIDEIAQAMAKARRVWFLGYRQNRNFAAYLRWQLNQVLDGPQVIPGPGETLGDYVADITDNDLLVVFALRRSVPLAATFAEHASQAGTKVLYITDHFSKQPIAAHWLLRCHTQAPGPLDNHAALMILCHLLATRVMEHAGAKGRRRMVAIEAEHDALSEL
ncbi:MAG TPA: MurR/RpiR family transcriptional regulator [Polaromonas sp.]|jgi:DNA-binding MurR/RpiR family transcriptional regulator